MADASLRVCANSDSNSAPAPPARRVSRKSRRSNMSILSSSPKGREKIAAVRSRLHLVQSCFRRRDSLHPCRVIAIEKLRRLVRVPPISVAPLASDFRHTIFDDTVPAAKDGPVGFDFIKARPQRRCISVPNHDVIDRPARRFHPANTVDLRALKPLYGGFDCLNYARIGMFDAHQKLDNADALLAAKRNVFVNASSSRRERNFIMLRAPDGSLSANHDLSFEDAFDAPGDGLISLRRPCFINKGVVRFALGDVTQESHHPNHRVVVEGDVLIVTLLDRIILGPPT